MTVLAIVGKAVVTVAACLAIYLVMRWADRLDAQDVRDRDSYVSRGWLDRL